MTLLILSVTKRELLLTVLIQFWAEGCQEERNTSIIVWFNTKFLKAKIILNVQHTVSKIDIWIKGVQEFIRYYLLHFVRFAFIPLEEQGGGIVQLKWLPPNTLQMTYIMASRCISHSEVHSQNQTTLCLMPQLHIIFY